MRLPDNLLELMIQHDVFRVCRLLPRRQFVGFCKERGLDVTEDRLEQLERIGVFRPLLRVYQPDITIKIERSEDGYRRLGQLSPNETWAGETRTEMALFSPEATYAVDWKDEGLLWIPGQGEWPHAASIELERNRHEAYYSPFQIWPLHRRLQSFTLRVALEWAVNPDGTLNETWSPALDQAAQWAQVSARSLKEDLPDDCIAVFCQFIANRFYFHTQTDLRRRTVTQFHDWDWRDYALAWSPKPFLDAFELSESELKDRYEYLDICWRDLDPLGRWYSLARFVRVDKRKRLKGDALGAVAFREMAHMLRLFHKNAFGADLCPLGESGVQVINRVPDIDPDSDPLRALELTANDYGVNGKPQLVLFVEGDTERAVIPSIFERLWGASLARFGIEIFNLRGVGNAAGTKKARYSALWLLVDYLHHHQTIAFVLLDNEGLAARNVRKGLSSAPSVSSELRKATRARYVNLWKHSFEFDNFSDTEIAAALNKLAGKRFFAASDVKPCRIATTGKPIGRPTLEKLYLARTGHGLNKVRLGHVLAEMIFDPRSRKSIENRPISKVLLKVGETANLNHQPNTTAIWESNQRSGYLGTLMPLGKLQRRRDRRKRKAGRR